MSKLKYQMKSKCQKPKGFIKDLKFGIDLKFGF